ncbi:MAG: hypothetical protein WCK41_12375 [Actinomycetes bacterium]
MAAQDAQVFPTEWVGTWSWSKIGAFSPHHEHFDPQADAVFSEWQTIDEPISIKVVRQSNNHFQMMIVSSRAESKAVGILTSDGSTLVVTNPYAYCVFTIDGKSMTGIGHARSHVPGHETEHFGAGVFELVAK